MGRKQSTKRIENPDTQRRKQRSADTKYRNKVQYLYELLRDNFDKNSTKETLLHSVLEDLNEIENDIRLTGPKKLADCRKDFLKILELEENIWKTEEEPSKWWIKVQEILNELLDGKCNSDPVLADLSNNVSYCSSATLKSTKKKYVTRSRNIHLVGEKEEAVNCLKRETGIGHLHNESIESDSYEFSEQSLPSEYLFNNPDWNI